MPPRQRAISVRRQRRRELNITVCCAPPAPSPTGSVVLADAARAAAYLADRPGRVLLATGAKELPAFAALDPAPAPTRAFCRRWQVSQHARQRAFRTAISLRCRGPFTKELNAALLHQFHIDYMVTRTAARRAALPKRPRPPPGAACSSLCCAARTTRARPLTQFYSDAGSFYEDHIGGHGQRSARQPDSGRAGDAARSGADHRRAPPAGKPARGLHGKPRSPL